MENLDLSNEKDDKLQAENQPVVHVHVPETIKIEIKDPIVLGFQLGCSFFVLLLTAGFLLFIIFLVTDMSFPF